MMPTMRRLRRRSDGSTEPSVPFVPADPASVERMTGKLMIDHEIRIAAER